MAYTTSDNNYATARYIVGTAGQANYTTIASAITAANTAGGGTIFILPGSYTENLTLQPSVNLTAYDCDALTPSVTIVGKLTFTQAGTASISGIRLQTNSDFALAVTGSVASIVNLTGCYLNCTNNTGISHTSSSSSSKINLTSCQGDTGTTGIAYLSSSSTGAIKFDQCNMTNTGSSTTACTVSASIIEVYRCNFQNPITTSSTGGIASNYSSFYGFGNTTAITDGGSGAASLDFCEITSGTATCVTTTQNITLRKCSLISGNAVVAGGAGTIVLDEVSLGISTGLVAPTTLTAAYNQYGINRSANQPAFFAYQASNATNVTGLSYTSYTLGTTVDLTEVFDQSSNFVHTTGVFTAPVTGRYQFSAGGYVSGCTICVGGQLVIVTSNRLMISSSLRAAGAQDMGLTLSTIVDMDSADTAICYVATAGEAGNTDDVAGNANGNTYFGGFLVC